MNQPWRQRVEELTLSILQRHKLLKIPIDPRKIAKAEGLKVISHSLEGDVSGVLIIKNGSGTIGVNPKHPEVRKRYTIAHELGHFLLNHQRERSFFIDTRDRELVAVMFRDEQSSTGELQQEREANAFAAALLMPADLIKDHIRAHKFDLTDSESTALKELAGKFKVSTQAMAFRLANLGFLDN